MLLSDCYIATNTWVWLHTLDWTCLFSLSLLRVYGKVDYWDLFPCTEIKHYKDKCVPSLLTIELIYLCNYRMFSGNWNRRNLNLTTWLKLPKVYGSHQLSSKYQLKVKVSVLSDLISLGTPGVSTLFRI